MNITYFFVYGRKKRIEQGNNFAKEMFYSYFYFKSKYENTSIIEFSSNKNFSTKIFNFFDIYLNKATKLPFFMSNAVNFKNCKKILNTDYLICAQDRIAISLIPILIISKIFNPKLNTTFFVMGLFNKEKDKKVIKPLRLFFLKLISSLVNNLVFLGEGEYELAIREYNFISKKSHLLPFMVDENFWQKDKEKKFDDKSGILFVGNDGHRDYELLTEIAKELNDYKFVFVTKHFKFNKIEIQNVKIFDGSWGNEFLSDEELKKIYTDSKLTIIPIRNTTQPSGQSVALQSMCTGTPVMMSDFDGLWDKKNINNNENIILIKENKAHLWAAEIKKYYHDDQFLEKISKNAEKLIDEKYREEYFNQSLEKIIGI